PLRSLETQRVNVIKPEYEPSEPLPALRQSELVRLLDRIRCVAAGIGQPDDLRLRRLRLQEEGREVRRVDRMMHGAENLAAARGPRGGCGAFEIMAERVVAGDKEPATTACRDHCTDQPVCQ